jgi:hypothetical protein
MDWRRSEMVSFGPGVAPLDGPEANAAYERAVGLCSRTRYGLDERAFGVIERLKVDEPSVPPGEWLAKRVGEGELLLVFGRDDAFRVSASLFLGRWQDMFLPSRDDVVILPCGGEWVLFYSHEDEFEFAQR